MRIQSINFNFLKPIKIYNQKTSFQNPFLNQRFDTFTFSGKKGAKHFTQDEIKNQNEKIKSVLLEAISEGQTLTGNQLAEKTGVARHNINKRLSQNEELYGLWQQVKAINNFQYSLEEKAEIKNAIKKFLEDAYESGQKLTMREFDKKLGVSKSVYLKIINENDYYKKMYEKVRGHEFRKPHSPEEVKAEEEKIKELLLDAVKNNIKRTDKEYGQMLGLTYSYFKKIVNTRPDLRALYDQIKNPPRKTFDGGFVAKKEEAKKILKIYAQKEQKIKAKKLLTLLDMSYETFRKMVLEDEELSSLWDKVKTEKHAKYSKQDVEEIDNYIHRFLTIKAEKDEKTTLNEIAQYYGLSPQFVFKRIRENPSLNYRWKKVNSHIVTYYDKDDKQMQTEQIIDTLKEAVKQGETLTYQELSIRTKLPQGVIINRIKKSPRAQKWWKENKNQK